jgi:hypothetical protein
MIMPGPENKMLENCCFLNIFMQNKVKHPWIFVTNRMVPNNAHVRCQSSHNKIKFKKKNLFLTGATPQWVSVVHMVTGWNSWHYWNTKFINTTIKLREHTKR